VITPANLITADVPPSRSTLSERQRLFRAAQVAEQRYPGPVGIFLAQELRECATWGYRLVLPGGRMARLVDALVGPPG
jgi:hypothetical protein